MRILVCEDSVHDEGSLCRLLDGGADDVVYCGDSAETLERVALHRPDLVIYALRTHGDGELGMLNLLRYVAPEVPLVVVTGDLSLEARSRLQALRPLHFAVPPLEPTELRDVVRAALDRPTPPCRP
jgi:DNA-binding NtrC family response regulator